MTPALLSLALVCAFVVDRVLGEPPSAVHPVVWIGAVTRGLLRLCPVGEGARPAAQLAGGALIAIAVPASFALAAHAILSATGAWPPVQFAFAVFLLKASFSLEGLHAAARRMQAALAVDLAHARFELRSLCSRDASALDQAQLIGATIESVAENASDSVVAPLLYYALLGVPGALAYRAVNTLDSMIGYRGRYEYLGKAAARIDDLLNLVPARLTAALLLGAGAIAGEDVHSGFCIARRDARSTASPNAGWPMATMAGLLGVQLDKTDCYRLGEAREALVARHIDRAWRIVAIACSAFALALVAVLGARHAWR